MENDKRFEEAVSSLSKRISARLLGLDTGTKRAVREVRIRSGRPIQLRTAANSLFCDLSGRLGASAAGLDGIEQTELAESLRTLCGFSVQTHQHELRQGFVTVKGGHRAGICASAVDSAVGIREVTSISLRIAREIKGCADELALIFSSTAGGLIVAGPPGSGKTTMIRELARKISSGETGRHFTVTLIDERGELAAVQGGMPQSDVGVCCDVLDGYTKGEGMLMAVRTLSPEVVICDEIGGDAETEAVVAALNAGVRIVATAHAGSIEELEMRPQMKKLIASGAFETAVLLAGAPEAGRIRRIAALKGSAVMRR